MPTRFLAPIVGLKFRTQNSLPNFRYNLTSTSFWAHIKAKGAGSTVTFVWFKFFFPQATGKWQGVEKDATAAETESYDQGRKEDSG